MTLYSGFNFYSTNPFHTGIYIIYVLNFSLMDPELILPQQIPHTFTPIIKPINVSPFPTKNKNKNKTKKNWLFLHFYI